MGSQESLLQLQGAGLREERILQLAHSSFTQVRAAKMRKTLLLLWWIICLYSSASVELQKSREEF